MATARALASNTMARVEVVPWSMARTCCGVLMGCGPAPGCAWRECSPPRGKKRPDRQLVQAAAGDTADQRTCDRHPPVVLRRRQRLRPPSGEEAEQARAKVARRGDGPGLEIPGAGPDGRDQEPDHERSRVGRRSEGVELLGNGKDPQHQESGKRNLVHERVPGRDALARMREEPARGAAVAGARQVMHEVVVVDDRPEHQIDETRPEKCARYLGDDVWKHLVAREAAKQGQRERHGGIRVGARHRASDIDGERDRETPRNAYAPIGVLVGAWIVERVHRGRRVAEAQDDEGRHALRDQLPGPHTRLGDGTGAALEPHIGRGRLYSHSGPSTMQPRRESALDQVQRVVRSTRPGSASRGGPGGAAPRPTRSGNRPTSALLNVLRPSLELYIIEPIIL